MALIEHSLEIDAPAATVWRVSQDYAVRYDWDPFPERIEVVGDAAQPLQRGTQVLVHSKLGMQMRVEFVQVNAPERAAIAMVEGPWFLSKFAGSWIFQAATPQRTLARFRYTVVAAPWWLRWLIEPLAAIYFTQVVKKRLAGLKRYCERVAAHEAQASSEFADSGHHGLDE